MPCEKNEINNNNIIRIETVLIDSVSTSKNETLKEPYTIPKNSSNRLTIIVQRIEKYVFADWSTKNWTYQKTICKRLFLQTLIIYVKIYLKVLQFYILVIAFLKKNLISLRKPSLNYYIDIKSTGWIILNT